jgi:hypothetical protein
MRFGHATKVLLGLSDFFHRLRDNIGFSLYFSLLAGNLRRRLVRAGLRAQPPIKLSDPETWVAFLECTPGLRHRKR